MSKIINKLLYFANGIAEQISTVDPQAVLEVTQVSAEVVTAKNGTGVNTLDANGLTITNGSGADSQVLSQSVLKSLIVLQGVTGGRAATKDELDSEQTARIAQDTVHTNAINDEISRATTAESNLTGLINQEVIDRLAADVQVRTDFALVDTAIRSELSTMESGLTGLINQEVSDRQTGDGLLNTAIMNEVSRAQGAESNLSSSINGLDTRVGLAETSISALQGDLSQTQTDLSSEVARATQADSDNASAIADEVGRALAAEGLLQTAITDEAARALSAESALSQQITSMSNSLEWQPSVKSQISTPPVSPVTGDRHLISPFGGSGAFVGKENKIAEWNGTAWVFTSPTVGMFVSIDMNNASVMYYGGMNWMAMSWENTYAGSGLTKSGSTISVPARGILSSHIGARAVTGVNLSTSIGSSSVEMIALPDELTNLGAASNPPVLTFSASPLDLDLMGASYKGPTFGNYENVTGTQVGMNLVSTQIEVSASGGDVGKNVWIEVYGQAVLGIFDKTPLFSSNSSVLLDGTNIYTITFPAINLIPAASNFLLSVRTDATAASVRRNSMGAMGSGQTRADSSASWSYATSAYPAFVNTVANKASIVAGSGYLQAKDGGITAAKLADDAVTTAKIADNAVLATKISSDALASTLVKTSNPLGSAFTASSEVVGSPSFSKIASSADGMIVFAMAGGTVINKSVDGGATFANTSSPTASWTGIACSADGSKVAAVSFNGQIYYSANSGSTWLASDSPSTFWRSITASSDGSVMVACSQGESLYKSTNGGATWVSMNTAAMNTRAIIGNGDLTKIVIPSWGADVLYSTDGGASFQTSTGAAVGVYYGACFSKNGNRAIVAHGNGSIYYSSNGGASFTASNSPSVAWQDVACSSDGMTVVATATSSKVYISRDGGATWSQTNSQSADWVGVTISANASRMTAAIDANGVLYSSVYSTTIGLAAGSVNNSHIAANAGIEISKIAGLQAALDDASRENVSMVAAVNIAANLVTTVTVFGKADTANAIDKVGCIGVAGVSSAAAAPNASVPMKLIGKLVVASEGDAPYTLGQMVYLSKSEAGKGTQGITSSTGSCVVELGVAVSATEIIFRPSFKYVVV